MDIAIAEQDNIRGAHRLGDQERFAGHRAPNSPQRMEQFWVAD